MFEIAGLILSGISSLTDLHSKYQDLTGWTEADIEVDKDWLELALDNGVLAGSPDDFAWVKLRSLPSHELRGTHAAVVAVNETKKLKYRIRMGFLDDPLILTQKLELRPKDK